MLCSCERSRVFFRMPKVTLNNNPHGFPTPFAVPQKTSTGLPRIPKRSPVHPKEQIILRYIRASARFMYTQSSRSGPGPNLTLDGVVGDTKRSMIAHSRWRGVTAARKLPNYWGHRGGSSWGTGATPWETPWGIAWGGPPAWIPIPLGGSSGWILWGDPLRGSPGGIPRGIPWGDPLRGSPIPVWAFTPSRGVQGGGVPLETACGGGPGGPEGPPGKAMGGSPEGIWLQ